MRVAILSGRLRVGGGRIIGKNISEILPKVAKGNEYLIIVPENCGYFTVDVPENVKLIFCPQNPYQRVLWEKLTLNRIINEFKPEWICNLGNVPVNIFKVKQSLLIHDPHLIYPENYFSEDNRLNIYKKRIDRYRLLKHMHTIETFYCQTDAIRQRLCKNYQIDHQKVHLFAPSLVNGEDGNTNSPEKIAKKWNLPELNGKTVFFYPAKFYGHKNHKLILETYKKYLNVLKDTVCIWTISKEQHPFASILIEELKKNMLQDYLCNLGPITNNEVMELYSISDVLIMPTKLETFGIPFVEAMATNTAILTTDFDFTRAVCGEAAYYIPSPDSSESLLKGMMALCVLHNRQELCAKGQEQILKYRPWKEVLISLLKNEKIPVN